MKYDLSLSTAYHPQSDRETERVNQEVKTYLWIFCSNNPRSWVNNISHTKFTHDHCPHSVTNQSLIYLMMGYESHALPSVIPDTAIPTIETRLKTLSATRDEALATHELAPQVMAAHICHSFSPFKLRDKVWLQARNLKRSVVNPKFTPKQEGPFTIIKVLFPIIYQLCLPKMRKIHPVFHPSLLSPYHENTNHSPNFPSPPPDLINGEEEYEVKKILCHHVTPTKHSFLI